MNWLLKSERFYVWLALVVLFLLFSSFIVGFEVG